MTRNVSNNDALMPAGGAGLRNCATSDDGGDDAGNAGGGVPRQFHVSLPPAHLHRLHQRLGPGLGTVLPGAHVPGTLPTSAPSIPRNPLSVSACAALRDSESDWKITDPLSNRPLLKFGSHSNSLHNLGSIEGHESRGNRRAFCSH